MVKESNRWMEISDVIPIFATLVWKLQIEASLRDALALHGALRLAASDRCRTIVTVLGDTGERYASTGMWRR